MLQAKYSSQFRRNDRFGKRFVYTVHGTPDEEQNYLETIIRNGWTENNVHDNGKPLFIVKEFIEVGGQLKRQFPKPSYDLGAKRDGTGFFIDDSKDTMKQAAKVEAIKDDYLGKFSALQDMGINLSALFGGAATAAPAAAPAVKAEQAPASKPEDVLADLQKGINEAPVIEEPVKEDEAVNQPQASLGDLKG